VALRHHATVRTLLARYRGIESPRARTASAIARAQRTARAGPSNEAKKPSPAVSEASRGRRLRVDHGAGVMLGLRRKTLWPLRIRRRQITRRAAAQTV
jgi:hypothetical protein